MSGGGGTFGLGTKPHWVQMALFGVFGYSIGGILSKLGLGQFLYNTFPMWKLWADTTAQAMPDNQWGIAPTIKVAGLALFGESLMKAGKSGKLSGAALNVKLPLAAGMLLDPPGGGLFGGGGGGGGYW